MAVCYKASSKKGKKHILRVLRYQFHDTFSFQLVYVQK